MEITSEDIAAIREGMAQNLGSGFYWVGDFGPYTTKIIRGKHVDAIKIDKALAKRLIEGDFLKGFKEVSTGNGGEVALFFQKGPKFREIETAIPTLMEEVLSNF